jgi:glyoxylase-like metal-dependent hydrolase (beta-lactamase superfamily II)
MMADANIVGMEDADRAPLGVVRVRAPNPSPLTLDGTNSYVVENWVIDPGPPLDEHFFAIERSAWPKGIEGIVLTHGHFDHDEGAPRLAERAGGVPVVRPVGDEEVGPFTAIATPGHSSDHVCLMWGRVCFTGDTVLGEGSVFVGAGDGSMAQYLESLRRLRQLDIETICPGHGPFVWDPRRRIDENLEHRLDRELRILDALGEGASSLDEILDRAWSDTDISAHPLLREAARLTLEAHLIKLRDEGRLPPGAPQPS